MQSTVEQALLDCGITPPVLKRGQYLPTSLALHDLPLNPGGLYQLRSRLGARHITATNYTRFLAADIAFLACGSSSNGQQSPPSNSFFPELVAMYEQVKSEDRKALQTRMQSLMYDLVGVIQHLICLH